MRSCKKCGRSVEVEHIFCWFCGFEKSKNPDREFCRISIENAETAAIMLAQDVTDGPAARRFPGGYGSLQGVIDRGPTYLGLVRDQLQDALEAAGINRANAPWLTPKAPDKIGCRPAEYKKSGATFGQGADAYSFTPGVLRAMADACDAASE